MPDIIQLLPDNVANQIAAGEVVQRPASAVKELVENAVDAGSTVISVILKDAGRTSIQVIDNGCGMSETDARLAFERHATSKIRQVNDLFNIRTMGFRGEALPSIAAVAQVSLKTKRTEDETGTQIIIEGSQFIKQEPVSCNPGSIFTVKNLFYNVPARRKFLKADATELKHIINEFQRIALANPEIEFSLYHNNTELYNLPAANFKQRIVNVFGKSINQNLVPLKQHTHIAEISGFIGKPEFAKRSSGEQFFFVNKRFIRHPLLYKAVMNGYQQLIPSDSFPSFFICFEVDPKTIDINIHPTKTEIKFQDEQAMFQLLQAAVREALGKSNFMPAIDFSSAEKIEIPTLKKGTEIKTPSVTFNPAYNPFDTEKKQDYSQYKKEVVKGWEQLFEQKEVINTLSDNTNQNELFTKTTPASSFLVQLKNKYILTPVKSGLMIIDQRRAHERILFERYLQIQNNHNAVAQQNLFPQHIELDGADHALLLSIKDDLAQLGFDIADFGGNSIVINGIPADSKNLSPNSVIESILEEYKTSEEDIKISAKEKTARTLAVASAIRYGVTLTTEEMQELVDRLFSCDAPAYSPSGKPVLHILSIDELEKWF